MPSPIVHILALSLWTPAHAGAPKPEPPCPGERYTICEDGWAKTQCCPAGEKCDVPVHTLCGYGRCVAGGDMGRCPAPEPGISEERTRAACGGTWERACVQGEVKMACFPLLPTNYSASGRNPQFTECESGRCSTSPIPDACYSPRTEGTTCKGGWTNVCLGGKLEERCLPSGTPATPYVICPDSSCAIGTSTAKCP